MGMSYAQFNFLGRRAQEGVPESFNNFGHEKGGLSARTSKADVEQRWEPSMR